MSPLLQRISVAMVWLRATHDDTSYEKYREKFSPGKLFPQDQAMLKELYGRYDLCSKFVHPSLYSVARHIRVETKPHFESKFNYFEVKNDDPSERNRIMTHTKHSQRIAQTEKNWLREQAHLNVRLSAADKNRLAQFAAPPALALDILWLAKTGVTPRDRHTRPGNGDMIKVEVNQ